jgi:DNA polymerase-3 subunit alpha
LPNVAPWIDLEQLQYEKEALGLYWSGHPVDRYADALRQYKAKTTADLVVKRDLVDEELVGIGAADGNGHAAPHGNGHGPSNGSNGPNGPNASNGNGYGGRMAEDISIGGIVSGVRPLKTRKGDRMCVFTLDDAHGSIEVVVFPDAFKQCGSLTENGQMVLVKGRFERDDDSARILAAEIVPLEIVRERVAKSVAIRLTSPPHGRDTFVRLWDVLMQHKGDRPVAIELQEPGRHIRVTIDVNTQIRVRPSERLVAEVEKICGAGSVSLL